MMFAKNEEHGSAILDGEAVLLNSDSGQFFRLEDVALAIWNRIDGSTPVDLISSEIVAEYEVRPERCRQDVASFCDHLADLGFLRRV